jgi:hypothetical protein
MKSFFRNLTLVFAAGCMGGLVNSLVVWLFGRASIPAELGVKLAPALTAPWLYPRLVWGGIWGFLFVLPVFRNQPFAQGLFFSLWPSVVQLFVVFPYQANKGVLGLDLGTLTPLFVLFFNAVWGLTAAFWLRMVGKN